MDRNSAIGLTLIAVLLLVYFNFLAPKPPVETGPPVTQTIPSRDSLAHENPVVLDTINNPVRQPVKEEKLTQIETKDLVLTFSSKGGTLKQVELKKFKTYYQKPLLLVSENSSAFKLIANLQGKDVDLYSLYYDATSETVGDSTIVAFTTSLGEGKSLKNIFRIPGSGYHFSYRIQTSGLANTINGETLTYTWTDFIPPQEKDIADSRVKSTINYYTAKGDFDGFRETSNDAQSDTFDEPIKWINVKQKFFNSAIIANRQFNGGEIQLHANVADSSVVKTANIIVTIPRSDVVDNKASFTYFFGPNDYKIITNVTPGFERNLYLGWPPVLWVNKFAIIPVFHFLEQFIGNYGVIIMILVIVIKLILTPLSYTSYLGMAKMRLLKPELDLIKEKNGDNMTQTQQDQMKLYQQAGVNPFSGCIPLVLQMPILFAMFYFFPVSVELRQQPFLWADDLSTYDSIMNLPFTIPFYGNHVSLFVLLMTASTLAYTWQNNQMTSVTGPMKSLSYIMPVVFMFVLNSFSAGLSFYYFISNLVTFAQQAVIKRFVDEDKIKAIMDDHKKKMQAGGSSKSKFMSKLEDAMKASEEARRAKKK